ncbi:MAG: FtsX-like permease family protein [Aigarchaeota archaeon]|nr:FtsX-like permease family protein [Aigarchaeota archaeon]MDW8092070.1 FtsX-like permease family protein [Nitrososphaerota archaeon]
MYPYLKSVIAVVSTFVVLIFSQQLMVGNELLLNLAHRTGIDPGMAVSSVILLVGAYFFLEDFLRSTNSSKVGSLRSLWLAIQGLRFRSFRSAAIMIGAGVITGSLFMQLFLAAGAINSIGLVEAKMGADLVVLPSDTMVTLQPFFTYPFMLTSSMNSQHVEQISSIEGVEDVTGQYFMGDVVITEGCGILDKVFLIVVESGDFVVTSQLGGMADWRLDTGEVIKGSEVPRRMYLYSVLAFFNFTIENSIPETGTYIDHVIYISRETAERVMKLIEADPTRPQLMDPEAPRNPFNLNYEPGRVNVIYVKAKQGVDLDKLAASIEGRLQDVKVIKLGTLTADIHERVGALMYILTAMNGGAIVVSFALISSLSYIVVNEQRREFGVFRAVGASRRFLVELITSQVSILTLLGGFLGMMTAWMALYVGYYDIMRVLKIPFLCPAFLDTMALVIGTLLFSLSVGVLASLFPSLRISRSEPLAVIRGNA